MARQMVMPSLLLLLFSLVGGKLEEGWRVVRQRECQDEEEYMCRQLAPSGICHGEGEMAKRIMEMDSTHSVYSLTIEALTNCRKSCREFYTSTGQADSLPAIVQLYGGLGDTITDPFGFTIGICDLSQGFHREFRKEFLAKWPHYQKPYVPQFTQMGFKKERIPSDLFRHILNKRNQGLKSKKLVQEDCTLGGGFVINCEVVIENPSLEESALVGNNRTSLLPLDWRMVQTIVEELGPRAEKWAGLALQATAVYGIRRYRRGSVLHTHLDRFHTHVISAILNIAQEVDSPWPLHIQDNSGGVHSITLQPGEILWYESARLAHARPTPLQGKLYDNVFLHFRPGGGEGVWYKAGAAEANTPTSFSSMTALTAVGVRRVQEELGLGVGVKEDWLVREAGDPLSGSSAGDNPRLGALRQMYQQPVT